MTGQRVHGAACTPLAWFARVAGFIGLPALRRAAAGLSAALAAGGAAQAGALELRITDAGGRPLPDAVVFLESPEAQAAARPLPGVEVAQSQRQFAPQVSVVTVGTAISFPNRDTVRHHVYSFSPVKKFEIKLYVGTPAEPVVFDRPGVAVLGCNIHDHMAAWVLIVETPWYGRSDADGRVVLARVPAGAYRLRAWHASLPVRAPASDQPLVVGTVPQQLVLQLKGATR